MNELDALRQEAETLKNAIRVSLTAMAIKYLNFLQLFKNFLINFSGCTKSGMRHQPGAGDE